MFGPKYCTLIIFEDIKVADDMFKYVWNLKSKFRTVMVDLYMVYSSNF